MTVPSSGSSNKHRKHVWTTSAVEWHGKWNEAEWKNGRVMVVDYVHPASLPEGCSQTVAQEFKTADGLSKLYNNSKRASETALRLIHVQNAPWAVQFLIGRFLIKDRDPLVGMDFDKWLKYDKPEWRNGKPLLKGKTWRPTKDPWRKITKTAFGTDYLKPYGSRREHTRSYFGSQDQGKTDMKMMELNKYSEVDEPVHGYDIYVQRLSVYIQAVDYFPDSPTKDMPCRYRMDDQNPSRSSESEDGVEGKRDSDRPSVNDFDNGNVVIVFENSQTGSQMDTLMGARDQIESRWRRLTYYLPRADIADDERLALFGTNAILQDVFKGLAVNWEAFLTVAETHMNILEDKIYEAPADETRAPELWTNSSNWLKVEKLVYVHLDIVKEMIFMLPDLDSGDITVEKWLEGIQDGYDKLANLVQEDLVKPTNNMNDLMHKSVGIRDSRHSLQLNMSLWRLSWVTFIFLPLSFIAGIFGMNTTTFGGPVHMRWYFIVAVPIMVVVFGCWYFFKHGLIISRQTPYVRGAYEQLYHNLTVSNPHLWSREGPRKDVHPAGFLDMLRWHLLTAWFDPRKALAEKHTRAHEDVAGSGLGPWARLKRYLAGQWTTKINSIVQSDHEKDTEAGTSALSHLYLQRDRSGHGAVEMLAYNIPMTVTKPDSTTEPPTQINKQEPGRLPRLIPCEEASTSRSTSGERPPSTGGGSDVMVEEWNPKDSDGQNVFKQRTKTIGSAKGRWRLYG